MRVAVVGATGMVGDVMLQVLAERNFPVTELIPVASEKSVGKEIEFKGTKYKVVGLQTAVDMRPGYNRNRQFFCLENGSNQKINRSRNQCF